MSIQATGIYAPLVIPLVKSNIYWLYMVILLKHINPSKYRALAAGRSGGYLLVGTGCHLRLGTSTWIYIARYVRKRYDLFCGMCSGEQ